VWIVAKEDFLTASFAVSQSLLKELVRFRASERTGTGWPGLSLQRLADNLGDVELVEPGRRGGGSHHGVKR
jgi:hypothetical protein